MSEKNIGVRILKTDNINWRELQFIQQDDFKEIPPEAKEKLKASLVSNNFIQPFYVWEDDNGVLFCLDGKHRTIFLQELSEEGYSIPYQLPAIFLDCKSRKEAAKLVLVFSSAYAKVTQDGLNNFITLNDLDWSEVKGNIDLLSLVWIDLNRSMTTFKYWIRQMMKMKTLVKMILNWLFLLVIFSSLEGIN